MRLGQLEKHPDYFLSSPIQYAPIEESGHTDIRNSLFKLTKAELELFPSHASISSILECTSNGGDSPTLSPLPLLKLNTLMTEALPAKVKIKLEHTVNRLNAAFSTKNPNKLIKKFAQIDPENSHNFIYKAVHINNTFFTIPYYRMEQTFPLTKTGFAKIDSPPAYETRQRDGAVCPSKKTFNAAYLFVQKSKMPSRTKSFILSILNRTAASKRKLF